MKNIADKLGAQRKGLLRQTSSTKAMKDDSSNQQEYSKDAAVITPVVTARRILKQSSVDVPIENEDTIVSLVPPSQKIQVTPSMARDQTATSVCVTSTVTTKTTMSSAVSIPSKITTATGVQVFNVCILCTFHTEVNSLTPMPLSASFGGGPECRRREGLLHAALSVAATIRSKIITVL